MYKTHKEFNKKPQKKLTSFKGLDILSFFMVIVFIFSAGYFQLHYVMLALPIVINYIVSAYFGLISSIDPPERAFQWNRRETRTQCMKEKVQIMFFKILVMYIFYLLLLGILYLIGFIKGLEARIMLRYPQGYPNPFHIHLSTFTWILLIIYFIVANIALWKSLYWFFARIFLITGYYTKKSDPMKFRIFKPDWRRIIFWEIGQFLLSTVLWVVTLIWRDLTLNDPYQKHNWLMSTFIGQNPDLVIVFLIAIQLFLLGFYWLDGSIHLSKRNDFVTPEALNKITEFLQKGELPPSKDDGFSTRTLNR